MKNRLKKFLSVALVAVMTLASVVITDIQPVHAASGAITEAKGWFETAYVKWTPVAGATGYNVYVKSASATDAAYVQLDDELIRKYPSYMRADALGLRAGDYVMKVVPVVSGKENASAAIVSNTMTVSAYDRSGFAFSSNSPAKNGVGAYNNDGTLKSGASVLYVTEANKNTVKMKIGNTEYTGVAAITQAIKTKNNCQPVAIRIIGQVTLSGLSCSDMRSAYAIGVKGAANVTFEGVGDDATLYTAGVAAFQSSSIEVRNLGLMNWGGGKDGDGITLKQSVGVWVHNNDIFYGDAGSDGDQAKGDGSMDLKDNSQYVTISYNHFWDSGKMSLCGMKSESGENWITYHHNWFDHSDSRHPRIRTMSVHVYNNYYDGNAKYGVGAAKDSEAFVEANYFRNCPYPMLSSMQGSDVLTGGIFSGENGGVIKAYNNYMEGQKSVIYANSDAGTTAASSTDFDAYLATSRSETVPSTYSAKQGGKTYSNFDTKVDLGVNESAIDNPADVPSIVKSEAGRLAGGDFKWTFDNSVDDASYSLNTALKTALNNYKTSLVSVGGGSTSGESHTHTYGEWVIEKEATETETGLKIRTCSVCGDKQTEVIPKKGSTDKPDVPAPSEGSYVQNFTADGKTSNFYAITGNLATNKGTVTYNGLTLTQCLKIESATNIKFTATAKGKLTLVFAEASKSIKVNGTKYASDSNGIVSVDVNAGSVEITKGDTMNLFYMVYTPDGTTEETHTHNYVSKVTKEATCTEAGVLTYTCTSTTGTCDKKTYTEAIPATGHKFSTEWTIDVAPTDTTPGSKSHHCTVCDAKTDVTEIPATGPVGKTGLYLEDGAWVYYSNGKVDTEYAGLAENEYGVWYVSNGTIDWNYTGFVSTSDKTDLVINGQVNNSYTGLVLMDNAWKNIKNGQIDTEYTGLVENANGAYYVANGEIDWNYTGFVTYNGSEHLVVNGKADDTFTGIVLMDGAWKYIKDGSYNTEYTGLVENANGTWYVTAGGIDWDYSGYVTSEGTENLVIRGRVNNSYIGVAEINGEWLFVNNGKVDLTYTGLGENEYGIWYIEKGTIVWDYTGLVLYYEKWWYVSGGKVDTEFTGIAENENGKWYISNGTIDWTYTGQVTDANGTWNVVNGKVVS